MQGEGVEVEWQVQRGGDAAQPRGPGPGPPQAPAFDQVDDAVQRGDRGGQVHGIGIDRVRQPGHRAVLGIELEMGDQCIDPALQRRGTDQLEPAGGEQGERALDALDDGDDMQARMRVRIRVVVMFGHASCDCSGHDCRDM